MKKEPWWHLPAKYLILSLSKDEAASLAAA